MPILPENDPAWQNLPKQVDVLLPDIPEIAEDAGQAPIFGISLGKYTAQAAEIFQLGSQATLGSLAVNIGFPVKNTFDSVIDALEIDVKNEIRGKLKEGGKNIQEAWKSIQDGGEQGNALAEVSVDTAVGHAVNYAAIIPVAGQVVKILWQVGKVVRGIVKFIKESSEEQAQARFPPTTFNPRLDNDVLNLILDDVHGKRAWGRRWGPPSMGEGAGASPDFRTVQIYSHAGLLSGEGGGFEIVRKSGLQGGAGGSPIDWGSAGWLGMIPGTPFLHQGVQVDHQGRVRDMGEILLPSSRQIMVWLWGSVMGHGSAVTPAMWCVDTDELKLWSQYIFDLHVYIHESLNATTEIKQKIIDYYNKRDGQKVFNWGTTIKPKDNEWDKYWPNRQVEDLRARQMGMLDTLMVAYVDDSFSAIKNDTDMRERWHQRRKQLLEHPARCDVDLSNVPDTDYKEALIAAGATSAMCKVSSMHLAAVTEFTPPKQMPKGTIYAAPRPSRPKKKKKRLSPIVPFVGLSAAAFWAWKAGKLGTLKLPTLKL